MIPLELTQELFNKHMIALGPFEAKPDIAIALSGGQDSIALTHLLANWIDKIGGKLYVFTVDHKLRKNSTDEAQSVSKLLSRIEHKIFAHEVLTWKHDAIKSRLQENARKARYELLLQKCEEKGILHLFLAHHLDDQIETFFQRLEKKSGFNGLLGMSRISYRDNIRILRPLLSFNKQHIAKYCKQHKLTWIDDPSNKNECFSRVKWRNIINKINYKSEFYKKWLALHAALNKEVKAQNNAIHEYISKYVVAHKLGFLTLDKNALLRQKNQKNILSHLISAFSNSDYPIALKNFENLILQKYPAGKKFCIANCKILFRKNTILLIREGYCFDYSSKAKVKEKYLLYDDRFLLDNNISQVKNLGQEKWKILKKEFKTSELKTNEFKSIVDEVFWTIPVVATLDGMEWAPYLNNYNAKNKFAIDYWLYFKCSIGMQAKA